MKQNWLKSQLKRPVERLAAALPSRVRQGDSLVLAYHNIVPTADSGYGDASLHTTEEAFASQLHVAKQECDIVSLSELIGSHGRRGRRVAISFDDAYSGCVEYGIPLCAGLNVQPVIFVAPVLLGHFMPWDMMSARRKWTASDRTQFLAQGGVAVADMTTDCGGLLPESYRISSVSQLKAAALRHRIEVANHSNRHINFSACDTKTAIDELSIAEDFLAKHFHGSLIPRCVAYPYGIAPPEALADELGACVATGFRVAGGWQRRSQPFPGSCANRLNIPAGISLTRFRAQLRGWLL
jgi:peptidoglycan/xylan/chitin deacetylase (PgdA/CDA1 family)